MVVDLVLQRFLFSPLYFAGRVSFDKNPALFSACNDMADVKSSDLISIFFAFFRPKERIHDRRSRQHIGALVFAFCVYAALDRIKFPAELRFSRREMQTTCMCASVSTIPFGLCLSMTVGKHQ